MLSNSSRFDRLAPWAFLLIALIVYWPTRHAGFVMDWLGWQYAYNREGWSGVLYSFGYKGLHPVLHLANYTLYYFFGTNGFPWYVVFAGVHGLNATLLYRLALRLPLGNADGERHVIALTAAGLFLLSPYAVEVVVWRVCIHYLLSLAFALAALHRAFDYLESGARRHWWWMQGFFLLGLFSLEWSLVVPVLIAVMGWVFVNAPNARGTLSVESLPEGNDKGRRLARIFLPQIGVWVGYFALNKILLGDWVGHYGTEAHLKVQPQAVSATMMKYFVKQFGFARYWVHEAKTRLFDGLDAGLDLWIMLAAVGILALTWLIFLRRLTPRLQWAGAVLACFFVALLPISNLYFYYLQYSENDRYGYFATGFGWLGLALLLSFLPKILSRLVALGLGALSLILLLKMVGLWKTSNEVYQSLVNDFRWYDRPEVIVLASPDNYQGVFMFRIIGQPNGFSEPLELLRGQPYRGQMWEAVQYNMVSPNDAIKVETDSTSLLYQISFLQHGNWWWRNGIGAHEYDNERYTFRKKEWHVEVALREKRPGTALIYPVGGKWKEMGE